MKVHENKIFLKTIDLGHSNVNLRNDGIIQVNCQDNVEIDAKESEEMVQAIGELSGGKKALVLGVAGYYTTATSAARSHSASPEGIKFTIADAFVINSLAQKLIGNFYLRFHKPHVPTRVFDNTDKAVEWLKSHL